MKKKCEITTCEIAWHFYICLIIITLLLYYTLLCINKDFFHKKFSVMYDFSEISINIICMQQNADKHSSFLLFFSGMYVSYLGGIWMPPYIQMLPDCLDIPLILPYVQTTPYVPNAPLCICMFWGICMWLGDVRPSFCLDNPHVFGHLSRCLTPHTFVCCPVCLYVLGVNCMCYGENPIYWGSGEHQHICQAFGVCQYIHWMSIMLHLVPFM